MQYIALGQLIARACQSHHRTVVSLALPTRAYCSVFLSLGIVLQREQGSRKSSVDAFFDYCSTLKSGTPITYRHKDKTYKGVFLACIDKNDSKSLEIKYKIGNRPSIKSGISVATALDKVQILDETDTTSLDELTGRGVTQNKFLEEFYRLFSTQSHQVGSRLDVNIIGQLNTLRVEIDNSQFAINNDTNNKIAGKLQDILRAKRLCHNNECYRSQVVSSDNTLINENGLEHAPFVIFDGASSFTKCRDKFDKSNWIVILDKADPHLDEAVGDLNEDYNKYGAFQELLDSIPQMNGVEFIAYQEEIHETHIS
ncbi:hypothetical protein ACFLZI_01460 [Nitrospirota bacterium]